MNGTCNNIERVSAYHDGELTAVAAEEVERHVAECDECSAELDRYRGMSRRFASAELPRMSSSARRRVRRAIEDEKAAGRLRIVRALTAIAASVFLVAATQAIHQTSTGRHPSPADLLNQGVVMPGPAPDLLPASTAPSADLAKSMTDGMGERK